MRFLMAVLALASVSLADIKIAHVDTKMIFERYTETPRAQREYDRQVQQWEQEAQTKQRELVELKERIERQALMLSEERKRELEAQLARRESEYQQFVQQIYGREGLLYQKNQEMTDPIVQKIRRTIVDVANREGYDMVLDRAGGAVIHWKRDNDLTDRVLDILNQEAAGAGQ